MLELTPLPPRLLAAFPFPSPFDEVRPHPVAHEAALDLQAQLVRRPLDAEGKMFGVLVVRCAQGELGYLSAFSGLLDGKWSLRGFAPPLFDEAARAAIEPAGANAVLRLVERSQHLAGASAWAQGRAELAALETQQAQAMAKLSHQHVVQRAARKSAREGLQSMDLPEQERQARLQLLSQHSQTDKAARRLLVKAHEAQKAVLTQQLDRHARRHQASLRLQRLVCGRLMQQIHDTYRIVNRNGETRPLRNLYGGSEPPSGAADCAGPKLLGLAYALGLEPVAMAEFWWGKPPAGGGRVSGAYYPACKHKCGPLLPFMLQGLQVAGLTSGMAAQGAVPAVRVMYEDDDVVVVEKPAGLLSVPGRGADKQHCVLTHLRDLRPAVSALFLVHRLDQDTSGLLLAAKSHAAYVALQRQFATRQVQKHYTAVLEGDVRGDEGRIELPLRLDVEDRPRQIVDPIAGKTAQTTWQVLGREAGLTRVLLSPYTGRTHQLRVHAAHPLGLGCPMVGDRLYGRPGGRLLLHAHGLTFVQPRTGETIRLLSAVPF